MPSSRGGSRQHHRGGGGAVRGGRGGRGGHDDHARGKAKASNNYSSSSSSSSHRQQQQQGKQNTPSRGEIKLQQALLDVFRRSFAETLMAPTLAQTLQEVKGHLWARDFAAAFGSSNYLEAYAVRWSAGRALAYAYLVRHHLREQLLLAASSITATAPTATAAAPVPAAAAAAADNDNDDASPEAAAEGASRRGRLKFICLGGGGGAELVALAALPRLVQQLSSSTDDDDDDDDNCESERAEDDNKIKIETVLIDVAAWYEPVVRRLEESLTTTTTSSFPSSSNTQNQNRRDPLIQREDLKVTFHQQDVLSPSGADVVARALAAKPSSPADQDEIEIITLMFTLNELYSHSLAQTQALLGRITQAAPPGTLLLVVDSAGSYSRVALNGSEKKYPMRWLLDYTLLKLFSSSSVSSSSSASSSSGPASASTSASASCNDRDRGRGPADAACPVDDDVVEKADNAAANTDRTPKNNDNEEQGVGQRVWTRIMDNDSIWFRLPSSSSSSSSSPLSVPATANKTGAVTTTKHHRRAAAPPELLEYPLDLENMRMQLHLYRRV